MDNTLPCSVTPHSDFRIVAGISRSGSYESETNRATLPPLNQVLQKNRAPLPPPWLRSCHSPSYGPMPSSNSSLLLPSRGNSLVLPLYYPSDPMDACMVRNDLRVSDRSGTVPSSSLSKAVMELPIGNVHPSTSHMLSMGISTSRKRPYRDIGGATVSSQQGLPPINPSTSHTSMGISTSRKRPYRENGGAIVSSQQGDSMRYVVPDNNPSGAPIGQRNRASKYCKIQGCGRVSQRNNLCHSHGGKRLCKEQECSSKDRGNGYCIKHGGGKVCAVEGCIKRARRKGLCTQHFRLENEDEYVPMAPFDEQYPDQVPGQVGSQTSGKEHRLVEERYL